MLTRSGAATIAIRATTLAAGVMVAGAAILLVAAVAELSTGQPGLNLVDAYWVGRLPWTPIGVGMVLFGATATIALGSVASWLASGWLQRFVSSVAPLPAAFWWATSPMIGYLGACCGPQPAYDPITIAYSNPQGALLLVVLPALIVAALVLLPTRARPAKAAAAIRSA
jgi:hypothetical protein